MAPYPYGHDLYVYIYCPVSIDYLGINVLRHLTTGFDLSIWFLPTKSFGCFGARKLEQFW